ncbi:hypothetical protein I549_1250 [Mycobacterium avium subsp. avium 2285 (R)]|nr:hypothetical protein I549_1250 [Mycobacterium avium subsp. avium 2285 (R)]
MCGGEYAGMSPFLGSDALHRGAVTRSQLRTRYRKVFRDVYIAKDAELTPAGKARAAWLSTGATLAGLSAAAIHGTKWLDAAAPAEIVRADRHGQRGILVRSYTLADDEADTVSGMRVTTAARTAFDIGCGLPAAKALPILDALLNATGIKPADVVAVADRHRAPAAFGGCAPRWSWPTAVRSLRRRPGCGCCWCGPDCRSRRRRSSCESCAFGWTWGGGSGRSPSSTTGSSTGTIPLSGPGTSSESRCSRRPAGP